MTADEAVSPLNGSASDVDGEFVIVDSPEKDRLSFSLFDSGEWKWELEQLAERGYPRSLKNILYLDQVSLLIITLYNIINVYGFRQTEMSKLSLQCSNMKRIWNLQSLPFNFWRKKKSLQFSLFSSLFLFSVEKKTLKCRCLFLFFYIPPTITKNETKNV